MIRLDFHLNKQLPIPLYYQLKQGLIETIERGELAPGQLLPSERELSESFVISRMTVRQAIKELEREGRVYRVQGKGTFISDKKVSQGLLQLTSFSENMKNQGLRPSSFLHLTLQGEASSTVKDALQLKGTEDVLLIERIRLADEKPMAIERTFLPIDRFPQLNEMDFHTVSLYEMLYQHYGIKPKRAVETIEAALADGREAELLQIRELMPVLLRKQITYDTAGRPFEYVHAIYRGDRYKLTVHAEG